VQLAWIKFRDLACAFKSAGLEGGSDYAMQLNACLEQLASCAEGDPSCL
jgi:uncharacterized protein YecT (DUF1311 family)